MFVYIVTQNSYLFKSFNLVAKRLLVVVKLVNFGLEIVAFLRHPFDPGSLGGRRGHHLVKLVTKFRHLEKVDDK